MRCEICNEKKPDPTFFAGRFLCDGCYCEYRAIFQGKISKKRKNLEEKKTQALSEDERWNEAIKKLNEDLKKLND